MALDYELPGSFETAQERHNREVAARQREADEEQRKRDEQERLRLASAAKGQGDVALRTAENLAKFQAHIRDNVIGPMQNVKSNIDQFTQGAMAHAQRRKTEADAITRQEIGKFKRLASYTIDAKDAPPDLSDQGMPFGSPTYQRAAQQVWARGPSATAPPDLSDTGQAFGAGRVPGLIRESGIVHTPEEIARLQAYPPDVTQGLIQQGNIGPVTDIGQPHAFSLIDAPILRDLTLNDQVLPLTEKIGGMTLAELATLPVGLTGGMTGNLLRRVGMGTASALGAEVGARGAAIGARELGLPPEVQIAAGLAGGVGGAVAAPAAASRIGRSAAAGIGARGGPGGYAREIIEDETGSIVFGNVEQGYIDNFRKLFPDSSLSSDLKIAEQQLVDHDNLRLQLEKVYKEVPVREGALGGAPGALRRVQDPFLPDTDMLAGLLQEGVSKGGNLWYHGLYDGLTKVFNSSERAHRIVKLIAVFSPQTGIERNVRNALAVDHLFEALGGRVPTAEWIKAVMEKAGGWSYGNSIKAAQHILETGDMRTVTKGSGNKIKAYYANMMGDENAVTLDTWMLKLFGLRGFATGPKGDRQYAFLSDFITQQAKNAGLSPRDYQAAVWVAAQGRVTPAAKGYPAIGWVKELLADPKFRSATSVLDEAGKARTAYTLFVARAIAGGAAGATQGDTLEERARNAMIGAGAAAVGPELIGRGVGALRGRGVMEEAVPASPETLGRSYRDKFLAARQANITERARLRPEIEQQTAERVDNYEDLYQKNLAAGASNEEAHARAMAALEGQKVKPAGSLIPDLTEADRQQMWDDIEAFDFGRGRGADYEKLRARSAMSRLSMPGPDGKVQLVPENEWVSLEKVFGSNVTDVLKTTNRRETQKGIEHAISEAILLPKALLSSLDDSAAFRQTIIPAARHPTDFIPSVGASLRSLFSKTYFDKRMAQIASDTTPVHLSDGATIPFNEWADKAGIISFRDERFGSQLAERLRVGPRKIGPIKNIPQIEVGKGVAASNRAFAMMGTYFRMRMAKSMFHTWETGGSIPHPWRKVLLPSEKELQTFADMLNRATGRGTFSGPAFSSETGKRISAVAQAVEWAPATRLAPVQLALQMLNPKIFLAGTKEGRVAREAFQNFAAFVATGSSILAAFKLTGAGDVVLDPRSPEFGKVRIGNQRFNIWGSSQPLSRAIAQIATGARLDPELGVMPADRLQTALRYFQSGLAPEFSVAWDYLTGEDYLGNDIRATDLNWWKDGNAWKQFSQRVFPLVVQDIMDAWETGVGLKVSIRTPVGDIGGHPVGAAISALPSFFGVGPQSYDKSVSGQLQEIPRWVRPGNKPFTPREVYTIESLIANARANKKLWAEPGGPGNPGIDVPIGLAVKMTALEMREEASKPQAKVLGAALNPSEDVEMYATLFAEKPDLTTTVIGLGGYLNPDWLRFVALHRDELREASDIPDKYSAKYINDMINILMGNTPLK